MFRVSPSEDGAGRFKELGSGIFDGGYLPEVWRAYVERAGRAKTLTRNRRGYRPRAQDTRSLNRGLRDGQLGPRPVMGVSIKEKSLLFRNTLRPTVGPVMEL